MRLLPSSLGITAFAAAIAVGVRTNTPQSESPINLAKGPGKELTRGSGTPVQSSFRKPACQPQASEHRNLSRLTATLGLSIPQQEAIHPALLRSHPHYDPGQPYLTLGSSQPSYLGPALTKRDFEDQLFAILDGEQQLDYVAATTEADAWWRSLISRLEADLESQTNPVDNLPSPHLPEPVVPDPVAPSPNRGRTLVLPPSTD